MQIIKRLKCFINLREISPNKSDLFINLKNKEANLFYFKADDCSR